MVTLSASSFLLLQSYTQVHTYDASSRWIWKPFCIIKFKIVKEIYRNVEKIIYSCDLKGKYCVWAYIFACLSVRRTSIREMISSHRDRTPFDGVRLLSGWPFTILFSLSPCTSSAYTHAAGGYIVLICRDKYGIYEHFAVKYRQIKSIPR